MTTLPLTRRYLVHPRLDLWLVAGMSLFFWALFTLGDATQAWFSWGPGRPLNTITQVFVATTIWVNYPHFIASYRLAYSRGWKFILSRWVELILVPLAMVAAMAYASIETQRAELVSRSMITLMLVLVGWHYAKQFYGSVMVAANYQGYSLTPNQRNLLKYNFLSVWWYALVSQGSDDVIPRAYEGVRYVYSLPTFLPWVAQFVVFATTLTVIVWVFLENYKKGRAVPRSVLLPWLTFFLWLLPVFLSNGFFLLIVPFFHGLQYLAFCFRMEREKAISEKNWNWRKPLGVYVFLVLLGLAGFEWLPAGLERWLPEAEKLNPGFFQLGILAFINIHHFFVDSVIWRFDNEFVRRHLLVNQPRQTVLSS